MLKKLVVACSFAFASLLISGYALAYSGETTSFGAPKGVSTESEVYKNWCEKQSAICQSFKNKTRHDNCINRYIKHGCV